MKRIGILTAGGDTPALNATVHGAVVTANRYRIEVCGFMQGFTGLLHPRMPHLKLNPLFTEIPDLDPTRGGSILGASREYMRPDDKAAVDRAAKGLEKLGVEGLICVGGDGTLNGLQPLTSVVPVVLAPKTIDNDLGLNYINEPDEWSREPSDRPPGFRYARTIRRAEFRLEDMVNYVTPGFATAVFVSAGGVTRVRTTAESHRRIAIVEVMGRHSGYLAIGTAYGQPDMILVPEYPLNADVLVERVEEIYNLQRHVVIVCGEGIIGEDGTELGASRRTTDPAGNIILSGAAEELRRILIERMGDGFFQKYGNPSAEAAIFTRKVGHTQRGGAPVQFDRHFAALLGGKAVEMLVRGENNAVALLEWSAERGFYLDSLPSTRFVDRWGVIHPRQMHPSFFDPERLKVSQTGIDYLVPIFRDALSAADVDAVRRSLFASGNLLRPYHSSNTDIAKRIEHLDEGGRG